MKRYGYMKATEFTKKQIGVIYRLAKTGELKVEKWVISEFYVLADYYGYDYNGSVESCETSILKILDAVFAKDLAETQERINEYTEKQFDLMGRKAREKADKNYL